MYAKQERGTGEITAVDVTRISRRLPVGAITMFTLDRLKVNPIFSGWPPVIALYTSYLTHLSGPRDKDV